MRKCGPKMRNLVHPVASRVDPPRRIAHDRAVFPAAFPKLVDDLHVVVGDVIAFVMLPLLRQAHRAGSAVLETGDDVPTDPAVRQMVERGEFAREKIGRLVGQIAGDAEAQMLSDISHRRDEEHRIVHRKHRGAFDRSARTSFENVIDAIGVGEEDRSRTGRVRPIALRRPKIPGSCIASPCSADDSIARSSSVRACSHRTRLWRFPCRDAPHWSPALVMVVLSLRFAQRTPAPAGRRPRAGICNYRSLSWSRGGSPRSMTKLGDPRVSRSVVRSPPVRPASVRRESAR